MSDPIKDFPARYSPSILKVLAEILEGEVSDESGAPSRASLRVLDPLAGIGTIHSLASALIDTYGIELEHEWADANSRTIQGDARKLPFKDVNFDAIVTSPTYGNRMADHHNATDDTRRITYKHALGHDLSEGNTGAMQWGKEYQETHLEILMEMRRVTKRGGLVVVNVSNHIRDHREVHVAEWWLGQMLSLDLKLVQTIAVVTQRMGFGQNRDARVENEWIFVTRRREA